MRLLDNIRFDAPVNSLRLGGGGRIAVAVGDHEVFLCRVCQGRLAREEGLPVPLGQHIQPGDQVRCRETKIALADEHTLLVARTATRLEPYETWVELMAVDLRTKQERGYFRTRQLEGIRVAADLVPISPHHVLLGVHATVLCIDLTSFREVCRAREVSPEGDVIDPDAFPEEHLAPDGFVYDETSSQLYLLCGIFNEAFLLRYRLEALPGAFGDEPHRFVRELRRSVLLGHRPAGLCLNPSGNGVTAALQILDNLIDLRGQEVTDWPGEQARLLALQKQAQPPMPKTARLGCLCVWSQSDEELRIDISSEIERDFLWQAQHTTDAAGKSVIVGYRLSAGLEGAGEFMTRPVYLDGRRLAIGTPSGILLQLDTASRRCKLAYDFKSPITSLQFDWGERLLLVGCEDGGLSVLSA